MDMLRFEEDDTNSSFASIVRQAAALGRLGKDLRRIATTKSLPVLDAATTPVIDDWVLEGWLVPMLAGRISYPDHRPSPSLKFTAPVHLFSSAGGMARTASRWYLLGTPSPLAEDSIYCWSTIGEV